MSAISTWHPASGIPAPVAQPLVVARPRSRAARLLVLVAAVATLSAAGWWVSNSPVFDMSSLKVEGNAHLTAKQLQRLSGLTSQTNVLWLSKGVIEQQLEQDPWVQSASVTRDLPTTITITITERVPAAVTAGANPMLVAADGTVLGRAAPDTELPLIVPPPGTIAVGQRLPVSAELAIVAALSDSMRALVTTVTKEADGSLALLMRDGITVFYGDASHTSEKAEALTAVLGWARRQGIHPAYVDVRAPTAPSIGTAATATVSPGA